MSEVVQSLIIEVEKVMQVFQLEWSDENGYTKSSGGISVGTMVAKNTIEGSERPEHQRILRNNRHKQEYVFLLATEASSCSM